ncbi:hypothetical protein IIV30_155R [Invertebrate iridescent virus 30]|uniref:Uncharacterized protein n=1 Tax=Invertebrate iridescent virus 30 TaxID=345585 RepID=W8W2K2_9VIRU|nr:hypothetical protein IIV30_155R [Invertebrate iridescent virus 30]CCV02350.1 hypothetical protein IIV30_155R [Invertebrate iridescent virus 30]
MEDYITLTELYIFDSKLFKSKNLKSFFKTFKMSDNDMVKLKGNKIGIKSSWVKKKIPSFNLKLEEIPDNISNFFEVKLVLEKYNCKTFNPTSLYLDSTMVKYFLKEEKRTPFFTQKGLIKIMVFYNDLPENIFKWIFELNNGSLKSEVNNLDNIIEMVNLNHPPIIKNNILYQSNLYSVEPNDIILDFKRVSDFKKEPTLIEKYKCPVYTQIQVNFQNSLKEMQSNFDHQLKELKQDKIIQILQQELDKEKSLKNQVLQLTQSFIPMSAMNGNPIPSPSPYVHSPTKVSLKPSKIK